MKDMSIGHKTNGTVCIKKAMQPLAREKGPKTRGKLCDSFDAECLKMRVWLEGVDDSMLGEGRGPIPKRTKALRIQRKCASEIGLHQKNTSNG